MKIYELARQINVSGGAALKAAREMGLAKAYNMMPLSDEQARMLIRRLTAGQGKEVPPEPAPAAPDPVPAPVVEERPKPTKGVPLKPVSEEEDRRRLSSARARALAQFKRRKAGIKPFAPLTRPKPAAPAAPQEPAPAAPAAEAAAAPEKPAPLPPAPAETPAAVAEKPAEPASAREEHPAAQDSGDEGLAIDLGSLGSFNGAPQDSSPRVVFHPATADDYIYDDKERRDDDDFDDDDLQREYFGGRRGSGGTQQSRHHRDDRDDDRSRSRNARGAQHGTQPPVRGQQGSRGQQGRAGAAQPAPAPRGQQGARPGAPAQQSVFPTRAGAAQQSVFPTRAGAAQQSVFPTRAGATQQSVFPTRAGATQQSVFPTRAGASQQSAFPTRAGAQGRQAQVQGFVRGQPPAGRNQRGQQPMNKNQRSQQPGQNARQPAPPTAPAVQISAASEKVLSLKGPTLIRELADMMEIRPNRLIADLMQEKVLVSINQRVDLDMAGKIAAKYGFRVELERTKRSTERKPEIKRLDEDDEIPEDKPEDMRPRPPVVTFLGHVDHGKTSLLDYIRKTKVAAGEAGGITQHIGAYSVDINDRKITFLDTPGHAAFSAMRARGARLTDIAVIVVAADDGIMPQTREVIKQCRQANVQMMVAINKCDLPSAKPDRVRQQLQGEGLTPEDWGGDIVCCEVSAHTGAGMDNLLEMILLQADVLELQANPNRRADGYVIEAQMERGIGPTATLLVASGALNVGDVVLIDENYGRLRALIDDRGNQVKSVGPAQAVRVMGLSGVPEAGAEFRVMTSEKRARELAEKFAMERKANELQQAQKSVNLDTLLDKLSAPSKKQLSIIVKADTQGTVEAIIDTLRDIRSEKITLEILGSSIGNVTANDVQRAAAGHAMIVGFQVNTEAGVGPQAIHDGVRINTFRIIYELFDFVKQSLLDMLDPEYKEVVKGHAQIRQIFDIGKLGKVAGSQLLDGVVRKDARVRVKRLREILFDGKVATLRHFKDEVTEVRDMQEFGISFVDFEDFQEGDVIECYAMEELERTL